jgi:hypothetical protein
VATTDTNTTPAAYSIREFCIAHRISEAKYFALKAKGEGPIEMRVGRRRLISHESASEWRHDREAADREATEAARKVAAARKAAAASASA